MAETKTATLTIDGVSHELPVLTPTEGPEVLDIRKLYAQAGVFTYDPGFTSTAACDSTITFIDGDKGVLLHRGYPIEQLAEKSHFLEVCYLLLHGDLPSPEELEVFETTVTRHTMIHEQMHYFFRGFRRDAHPMATMVGVVGAMSAFYHDSTDIHSERQREIAAFRLIAKMPTIAAMAYKYSVGQPFVYPRNDLDYASNFLHMCFAVPAEDYVVNPTFWKSATGPDHDAACRSRTERLDLDRASGGVQQRRQSLCLHRGGDCLPVGACAWRRKSGRAGACCAKSAPWTASPSSSPRPKTRIPAIKLMGFGHRVYKNFDPRATVMKESADEVLELLGIHNNPLAASRQGAGADRAAG